MTQLDIIEKYKAFNYFGKEEDMHFEVVTPGEVVYTFTIQEKHLSTPVAAHGGAIAGFMDAILGVTGLSYSAESDRVVTTVEFKINYLKPAFLGDKLIGKGKLISAGKRILFVEATISTEREGETVLIATGAGTLNAFPAAKAKLA